MQLNPLEWLDGSVRARTFSGEPARFAIPKNKDWAVAYGEQRAKSLKHPCCIARFGDKLGPANRSLAKAMELVMLNVSKQEAQVLECVRQGLHDHEIAVHLGVSEPSVAEMLGSISGKVEVSSRLELLLYLYSELDRFGKRVVV